MDKDDLLERYEALGQDGDFMAAEPLFELALSDKPDAAVHRQYGYLPSRCRACRCPGPGPDPGPR